MSLLLDFMDDSNFEGVRTFPHKDYQFVQRVLSWHQNQIHFLDRVLKSGDLGNFFDAYVFHLPGSTSLSDFMSFREYLDRIKGINPLRIA